VVSRVQSNGGNVVVPAERTFLGNVYMAAGDTITLNGLRVKAHDGLHSTPVRIFEVTTPGGLRFLHTGDNQTSTTLPSVDGVDVLFLNAWVNESGQVPFGGGIPLSMAKIHPKNMIPGHIRELNHDYRTNMTYPSTYSYIDERAIPMVWGESFSITKEGVTKVRTERNPGAYWLEQNFPNPFNPKTNFGLRILDFGLVNVTVYDVLGREVAILVNEELAPGTYTTTWDASAMASGVYFYRLEATGAEGRRFVETKKMVLLR